MTSDRRIGEKGAIAGAREILGEWQVSDCRVIDRQMLAEITLGPRYFGYEYDYVLVETLREEAP